MTSNRLLRLLFFCGSLLITCSALAHDYWFKTVDEDYLLFRGHRFSQHQGEKEVPFDARIIDSALCLSVKTGEPKPTPVSTGYPPRIQGPCISLLVSLDSGYWSQTLTGTKNQPKDELFAVLRSWHALETVKHVKGWSARLQQAFGPGLELVLREDPFNFAIGDKLRLTAMLNGQPVAGVNVAYHGDPRGVTGDDGRINLKIRHTGLQLISASLEQPIDSAKADKQVRSTVLMFNIPKESP
jgi:nickel transport protein